MLAASVSRLAQAVKTGPGAFGHPALDVVGQPAPDRAPGHVQLLAGQQVHEHRHGDPTAAQAAQELPHSRARSAGRRLGGRLRGRICARQDGDTGKPPPGDAGQPPGRPGQVCAKGPIIMTGHLGTQTTPS